MREANLLQTTVGEQDSGWAGKLYTAGLFLFAFTCNFSISAAQISLGLALIGFTGLYLTGKIAVRPTPLDKPFAFFALAGFLSIFRAEEFSLALTEMKTYLRILCFYLVYWYSMSESVQKKLIGTYVFSAGLLAVINGLRMPTLEHSGNRAIGFFSMAMTFGECQALGLLVIIFLAGFIHKNFATRAFLLLAGVATAYSVLLAMVRCAWLGVLAGLPIIFFSFPKRTMLISLVILIAIIPMVFANPDIQDRFAALNPELNAEIAAGQNQERLNASSSLQSSLIRMTIWWRGFLMTENNFLFGVGLENIEGIHKRLVKNTGKKGEDPWGHQHNNFMQFLVSTGFVGLIAFFYFIIAALKFFAQPFRTTVTSWSHSLSLGSLAIFICFLTFGIGEFSWGDEEVTMMALFLTGLMMNRQPEGYDSLTPTLAISG